MFASDLEDLTARETLSSVGELHVLRNRIDVDILRHGLHFADLHPGTAIVSDHELVGGGEQSRVYGGSGCPSVAEFAVAEFGVMIGRSTGSAAKHIGQALALRHRLPRIWAQVQSEHATAWKACNIASACMELSEEAAGIVDRRVAGIVDTLSPLRLHNIVKAALWEADPAAASALAEERARERGVWAGRTDGHGTTTLFIKAPTGAVIRFQATLNQIADALAALGDTSPIDERRARAIDIIADPALTADLLQVTHHLTTHEPSTHEPSTSPAAAKPAAPATPAAPAAAKPTAPETSTAPAATTPTAPGTSTPPTAAAPTASETSTPPTTAAPTARAVASPDADTSGAPATPAMTAPTPPNPPNPVEPLAASPGEPVGVSSAAPSAAASPQALQPDERPASQQDEQVGCRPWDAVTDAGSGLDSAARRELIGKLAGLKKAARPQPSRTTLYLHITDETLFAGEGVARVEGYGPVLVTRLEELIGHGQVTVRPVIDLKERLSVDAYEIPQRIRERIKLRYPAEQFPYGTGDSSRATDLDHIEPFRPNGPPQQTNTDNLIPLRRFSHRVKTHGGWRVRRLTDDALEWTTRHGFKFIVDHQGTRPADRL